MGFEAMKKQGNEFVPVKLEEALNQMNNAIKILSLQDYVKELKEQKCNSTINLKEYSKYEAIITKNNTYVLERSQNRAYWI